MRKLIVCVVLFAAVAAFSMPVNPMAIAQDKKKEKDKDTKKGAAGTIEISEGKDGKFRFGVRNADGKYLAGSPVGYTTAKEATAAAEELREVIAKAKVVMGKKKDDKDKKKDKEK